MKDYLRVVDETVYSWIFRTIPDEFKDVILLYRVNCKKCDVQGINLQQQIEKWASCAPLEEDYDVLCDSL